MKPISTALAAHIAGEVTTLATCWKLTRRDATILGFTDHDINLTLSGVTYKAATGFTPTAIESSAALNVDNLDVEGMLDSGSITESDVLAGLYDFAEIDIFMVNYADLTQGTVPLRTGWLGEVTLKNHQFVAEVRGLTQRLAQNIGELYSPSCRAKLGDTRCKVNMATHIFTGSVTGIVSNLQFIDTARTQTAGFFTSGTVSFTSGPCAGISMEVKEYTVGNIILALPLPFALTVGNSYSITRGCDKTFATCSGVFANAVNFRGEPHVPGLDRMLETSATRSEWN